MDLLTLNTPPIAPNELISEESLLGISSLIDTISTLPMNPTRTLYPLQSSAPSSPPPLPESPAAS